MKYCFFSDPKTPLSPGNLLEKTVRVMSSMDLTDLGVEFDAYDGEVEIGNWFNKRRVRGSSTIQVQTISITRHLMGNDESSWHTVEPVILNSGRLSNIALCPVTGCRP